MTTRNPVPGDIDTTRPNVARIYDYLLGGKDDRAVDREVRPVGCSGVADMPRHRP